MLPSGSWQSRLGHDDNRLAGLIAIAFVSILLAQVLVMPPFEGFDETAHYSYISYLADENRIPNLRSTKLDASIDESLAGLPSRYGGTPPFEHNDGLTYHQFYTLFSDAERAISSDGYFYYGRTSRYQPGDDINWQGQHPPLYYLMMTPVYRMTEGASPALRLILMRLASVLIAGLSLLFWYRAVRKYKGTRVGKVLLAAGGLILFFPGLYYDLGRIGNDALVALIFSGSFFLMLIARENRWCRTGDLVLLGIFIGLGLLTKQIFLPVALAFVLLALYDLRVARKVRWKRTFVPVGILVLVPVIVAGWWYGWNFAQYGFFFGGAESLMIAEGAPLYIDQVPLGTFFLKVIRSLAAFGATFLWSGSWSWVHRPFWHYLMCLPLIVLAARSVVTVVRDGRDELNDILRPAVLISLIIIVALFIHMIIRIKLTGTGTGGYYLYSVWPLVAILFASALFTPSGRLTARVVTLSLILMLVFDLWGFWFEAQMYAGIIQKSGLVKAGIGAVWPTPTNIIIVIERLREIAYPVWSACFFSLALVIKLTIIGSLTRLGEPVDATN